MTAVLIGHGLGELLRRTGDHPFVRWEVIEELADTWWSARGAVAFQRTRKRIRRTVNVLGDAQAVATLLHALPQIASSYDLVRPIDDVAKARSDEVRAFLEAHSPTADTEPGGGERWFAVEEPPGRRRPLRPVARRDSAPAHSKSAALNGVVAGSTSTIQLPELSRQTASVP